MLLLLLSVKCLPVFLWSSEVVGFDTLHDITFTIFIKKSLGRCNFFKVNVETIWLINSLYNWEISIIWKHCVYSNFTKILTKFKLKIFLDIKASIFQIILRIHIVWLANSWKSISTYTHGTIIPVKTQMPHCHLHFQKAIMLCCQINEIKLCKLFTLACPVVVQPSPPTHRLKTTDAVFVDDKTHLAC